MIWFGTLPAFPPSAPPRHAAGDDYSRMHHALEWVAMRAPHLTGAALVDALAETGWVDRATATQMLPHFRSFDPDRCFAQGLRRLAFRGASVGDEFRMRVARVFEEIAGPTTLGSIGPEPGIRFRQGEREGIVLAYPEVSLTVGGRMRKAVEAAVEEMPDTLVVIARNFAPNAAEQLRNELHRTEVPGTLVTVNLLLGIRAMALHYQPGADRVLDLLASGQSLRSTDIAVLGDALVLS